MMSVRLTRPRIFISFKRRPGHDRFAGARVIGQEKPNAREAQKIIVNGFELVRQRVHPGDSQGEVGVVLEGQPEAHGFDAEPEHLRIAIKGLGVWGALKQRQLLNG